MVATAYKWLLHLLKPFKIYLFLQLVIDYFKWTVGSREVRVGRKLGEENDGTPLRCPAAAGWNEAFVLDIPAVR